MSVDNRPCIIVDILGLSVNGLLDSAASCTILGRGCKEMVERFG